MTFTRSVALAAGSLCAATVLVACSHEKVGNPSPDQAGQPGTSKPSGNEPSSGPGRPIPPVAQPLDPSPWLSSPCDALSSDDLAELGLAQGRELDLEGSTARGCAWQLPDDPKGRVNFSVMTENSNGLNDIYRNHENSELREQVDVAGYPALHANFTDYRPSGECSLWVGVNDSEVLQLGILLDEDSAKGKDPCGFADRVGEATVENLAGL